MRIVAIDPGTEESARLVYLSPGEKVINAEILPNEALLNELRMRRQIAEPEEILVVEWITSYGMAVGREVFETCAWIGRFEEAFGDPSHRLPRKEITLHLCNSSRAKDANVRQVLIDRFGGTKRKAVGVKKDPGPLYGIKTHLWAALAVAVTFADINQGGQEQCPTRPGSGTCR